MTVRTGVDVAVRAQDLASPTFLGIERGMDRMAETAENVGDRITDKLGESVIGGISVAFAGAGIDAAFRSVLEGVRAEESGIDIGIRLGQGIADGLERVPIAGSVAALLTETLRPTIDDVLGYTAGRLQQLFPTGKAREFLQGFIDTPSDIDRRLEESRQRSTPNDADRRERERFEREQLDRQRQEERDRERQAADEQRQRAREMAEEERLRERERREQEAEAERMARERERIERAIHDAESRTPEALESRSLHGRAQQFVQARTDQADPQLLSAIRWANTLSERIIDELREIHRDQARTVDFG